MATMDLKVNISYSWTNYCRLCLLDDGIMLPLFDAEGLNRQIAHKIEACLQLVTYDGDPLPRNICHKCLYRVDQAYEFRTMALNSFERIKSHLLPLKHVPSVEQYLLKAGHLHKMSDQDVSRMAFSTRSEAKIRVKTEMVEEDPQCSFWPSQPFASTPKSSSSREQPISSGLVDSLKRKRFPITPDQAQESILPNKKAKMAGPASAKSSQWKCVFCLTLFKSKTHLNTHLEKCLRCGVCLKDFSTFREKVIHEAEHISVHVDCVPQQLRWECTHCDARFASSTMLSTHKYNHIPTDDEPGINCPSESGGALNKIPGIEKLNSKTPHRRKLACNLCYEEFDDEDKFVLHLYYHATADDDESEPAKKTKKREKVKKNSKMSPEGSDTIKCEQCHVVCRSKRYYKVHMATHVSKLKTSYPCNGCRQDFKNVEALNRHTCCAKQLNGLGQCCLDCGQTIQEYNDHVCDNKCPQCAKVFRSARGQRLHFIHKHTEKELENNTSGDHQLIDLDGELEELDGTEEDTVNNHNVSAENWAEERIENKTKEECNQKKNENQNEVDYVAAEERKEDSGPSGQDSDDCACSSDSEPQLSSRTDVRLPPDGASIVETVPCEHNPLTQADFGQSKLPQNSEANQNGVCLEGES